MAVTTSTKTINNPSTGKPWKVNVAYDSDTQVGYATVIAGDGTQVTSGTSQEVSASLVKVSSLAPKELEFFYGQLISAVQTQTTILKMGSAPTNNKSTGNNKANDDTKTEQSATLAGNEYAQSFKQSANKNNVTTGPGKRTYNPLGDFSSYTYRMSLYALSPDAYNSFKQTGQWDKQKLSLIVQSGGSSTDPNVDASRGTGFELDYYIDDMEITTIINAKETGMSTNSLSFRFKIIEPYGLTFPTKLVNLQQELQSKSSIKKPIKSFVEATHGALLLSLRFYGYDVDGNLISGDKYNNGSFSRNLDEAAAFERSFTVYITKLNFRLEGKGAVYDVECRLFDQQVGTGVKRSEIIGSPAITGATVKEMIGGVQGTSTGLIDKINEKIQEEKGKTCEIPDEYAIVYEETSKIKDAKMVSAELNKDRVPMSRVKNPGASNVRKQESASASVMTPSRTMTFTKGTTILQAIDQIITQSSYVDDALNELDSEEPQPVQEGQPLSEENAKPKTLQWYIINPNVEIIGYDNLRQDYAYRITYVIQSYDIPYVQSTNIKYVPKYPGPHKIYNYWYTGKNSEVLSYDQTLNNLFFLYSKLSSDASQNPSTSGVPSQPKPSNNADPIGKPSGTGEGAASIKTFLYSPQDQTKAKIRILGDPDFLMPVTSGTIGQMMEKWYGPDFTINPNSGQVFIEVIFNQVEDYSNNDGLLTPNNQIDTYSFTTKSAVLKPMVKGTVFMVMKVISRFSKGLFTQEFETRLPNFDFFTNTDTPQVGTTSSSKYNRRESSTANKTTETAARTGVKLNTGAGGGRGGQGGPNASQAAEITYTAGQALDKLKKNVRVGSTVNDDQYIPKVGTFANLGRENSSPINIPGTQPTGNSIMFKR